MSLLKWPEAQHPFCVSTALDSTLLQIFNITHSLKEDLGYLSHRHHVVSYLTNFFGVLDGIFNLAVTERITKAVYICLDFGYIF